MLLKAFAQLLFDQDIYKSNDSDAQTASPVNTRLLSGWLREAAELGLLPKAAIPKRTAASRRLRGLQTSYPILSGTNLAWKLLTVSSRNSQAF